MQSWIEVSSSAIKSNYNFFKELSSSAEVVPILKSNAYGHGLEQVYKILETDNPKWLGVNYVSAAHHLRELGFKGRLLVVGPVVRSEYLSALEADAEIFMSDLESATYWLQMEHRPKIHIKVDTGMSRQGFSCTSLEQAIDILSPSYKDIAGIASHFSNVEDVLDLSYATLQLNRFSDAMHKLNRLGQNHVSHIASSASTLLIPQSRLDLTRVGISLYGLWPSQVTRMSYFQQNQSAAKLIPALSWRTRAPIIKTVRAGEYVGYGCTYRAVTDIQVAVLPVGYFEGYPRIASGRGSYVLMKGTRCPIIGRICMNMMMIDISAVQNPSNADIITLIGSDGDELLDASTLANWSETIHYDLLTRLNPEIPRTIVD